MRIGVTIRAGPTARMVGWTVGPALLVSPVTWRIPQRPLLRDQGAIDDVLSPADVGRLVRSKEEDQAGDLVRVRHATQGHLLGDPATGLVGSRCHHRGQDIARVDRVDSDAIRSILDRDVLGHASRREFAADIGKIR